jgi:hypothetical protein
MGFNPYGTRCVLDFSRTRYREAEITVCPDPELGTVQRFDGVTTLDEQVEILITENVIIAWNLEGNGGSPLPLTVEAIQALPGPFKRLIAEAWIGVVKDPNIPLALPSPAGGT